MPEGCGHGITGACTRCNEDRARARLAELEAENEKFREVFKDLLSVRDRFAMAAMQAMLAAGHDTPMRGYEGWREEFMAEAYRWADSAMTVRAHGVAIPQPGQEKNHG